MAMTNQSHKKKGSTLNSKNSSDKEPRVSTDKEQEEEKKKKRVRSEIDDIFEEAIKSKKLKPQEEQEAKNLRQKKKPRKKKKNAVVAAEDEDGDGEGTEVQKMTRRRRTADGLAVYSAEELGLGNPDAGSTSLCPFDCSCCF